MHDVDRFRVRWVVMAFPTLFLACCVILALTVAMTLRKHNWRPSNLPLVFHGLGREELDAASDIEEYYEMKETAEKMCARLSKTAEGYKMMNVEDMQFAREG